MQTRGFFTIVLLETGFISCFYQVLACSTTIQLYCGILHRCFPATKCCTHKCVALQLSDMKIALRALGIIGKVLTRPWMRLLSKTTNILEMNKHFNYAHEQITRWSNDASPLLSVDALCAFREVDIKRDEVFDSLVKSNSDDADTKALLQDLCTSCLSVMNRQLQSQLGGDYRNPSAELLLNAASRCSILDWQWL